ncbi:MAG: TlpA disulfide reductase family protein [Alphaproteobacteria bacterium]
MTEQPFRMAAACLLAMGVLFFGSNARTAWAGEAPGGFAMHDEPRSVQEVTFVDGDARDLSLADFEGKVVLLNIWATWCAPCRHEMPTLDRLQAELGGPDFEVVALSIDRKGASAVTAFYEEIGIEALQLYIDQSAAAQRTLHVLGIPTTLLLGRDGRELGRLPGPAEWDSPEMVEFLRGHIDRTTGDGSGDRLSTKRLAEAAPNDVGDPSEFNTSLRPRRTSKRPIGETR